MTGEVGRGGEFNRQQRHGIAYRAASAPPAAFPVAVGATA